MSDNWNKVEVGDFGSVSFNGSQFTLANDAEVLRMPAATGDSWIFKETGMGSLYYVSEGCTVFLKRKANLESTF